MSAAGSQRRHVVEDASQGATGDKGAEQSRSESDSDKNSPLTEDKPRTSPRLAPRANRMPISRVRWVTIKAMTVKPDTGENQRESRKYTE